ncbi:MAG: non-ribosomal peptide synthase/polyketide synthase [Byssovorax sp.]
MCWTSEGAFAGGGAGELYIGGAGVARGYLNRPEQTRERFLPDPFTSDAGARMYRTGDRVKQLADGRVVFLGRMDHQIKIRGYRVELGEIEAALSAHEKVREAVVLAKGEGGDARLVGYVVGEEGSGPEEAELLSYLGERLPPAMVPSAIVALSSLPLTPNGKIDRQALASLERPEEEAPDEIVGPRGPVEEVLASIWCDVFGRERIGIFERFTEIGGHSLLAIQIIARVREAFRAQIPLRAIFDAPTIAALAERVEEAIHEEEGITVPPIERVPRDHPLRLSFAQERLWFLDQLDPGSAAYNVPFGIRLGGLLDERALARALTELCRRHEVLRTSFASADGKPVQIIHDAVEIPLPAIDLGDLPAEEREERARAEARAEAQRPFRLTEAPLLRARLLRLGPEEHVLLVTMHHIVSDGWTRGILNREVGALYAAFRAGAPSPLPELPLQYADYAEHQRRWLDGEVLQKQLAYWKAELSGAPFFLALPTDRPHPPVQSQRGAQKSTVFAPPLSRALRDLARREGATLYMTLLAALDVLLYRITGQADFLIGTSVTNRTRAETEKLIGFFINALVLRARLSPDLGFRALLAQVRETCLGAYAHQDMPFERLVQELSPAPDPSRAPLFQVIFTMHNAPPEAMKLPGLTLRRTGTEIDTSKYDLTFVMGEGQGAVGCSIAYKTDLFDEPTIDRMLLCFTTLLEGIVASPDAPIAALPLITRDERHRLLSAWNDTATSFSGPRTIAQLFEAQADRTPEAIALVAGGEALSFEALDRRANRVAHHLRRLGIGPDAPVGLLSSRSAHAIVGLLGILKAGGAYVPLDPAHPPRRLGQLLDEAGIPVVLAEGALSARLPPGGHQVVDLASSFDGESEERPMGGAGPEHLCYVLFTSGSTGTPKGVAVEHRQLVNYVHGVSQRLGLGPNASYAHVSTLSADLGNTVLFPPLCLGGTLHLLPEELTTDPDGMASYMERHRVDCLKIVPSHLSALLSGSHPSAVLPHKVLVLGGEASSWELVERIEKLSSGLRIINHYGPTETTVGVLTEALARGARVEGTLTVPVGRPLANSRVYVLDERGEPSPVGVPGELYIGGAGVARGYLNRPEQTRERFLPDPFTGDAGARMYRTGDRVKQLADGRVVFLGRMDHQIKIRGYRVELGEIEAALSAHEKVREAVVLAKGEGGDARLVGYVVGEEGSGPEEAELLSYLGERLPPAMVPSAIVALSSLPLTPNGKIDRQALAAHDVMLAEATAEGASAARGPVEEVLAGIWAEVFGREGIGLEESFSALGGHSLLAIQIIARARDAFQTSLPLRALFEAPTIRSLARRIEQALAEGRGLDVPPIARIPRGGPLRLSYPQERLWFLNELDPESASYNVPLALRLRGALDRTALEQALSTLVDRHEILRTTFAEEGGQPVLRIAEHSELSLPFDDLGALPVGEREQAARGAIAEEARRPFDLRVGPLCRARLYRLSVDEHVLSLTVHHIVSDGVTRGILVREIGALYRAFHAGEPSALAPLPFQYADHAEHQRRWLEAGALAAQLAYWREQLDGAPRVLDLPLDHPRPATETQRGARRSFVLPDAVRDGLLALARREGATMFMVLLAAFELLLFRHTGQADFLVGTPAASRSPETEGMVGLFLNTLVLRAKIDPGWTFLDLLSRVRETCLGAYTHQDLPFERLVSELSPERDLARSPLFQVMFTFQTTTVEVARLPDLSITPMAVESAGAKLDLTLGMGLGPEGLGGTFEHRIEILDTATIDRWIERLSTLLAAVAADPDRPLSRLPMLPDWERHQLITEHNRTAADYPRDRSVLDLIVDQAKRSPDALAASSEGRSLSYGELVERARRLSGVLRAKGIGPGAKVGIALDRSLDLLVSTLGIWGAGAAYVPLDPAYPRERLSFMIEDAGLSLVLAAREVAARLPAIAAPLVLVDDEHPGDALEGRSAGPEDIAYVIYTSGSTGLPKGVEIPHRALVAFLWAMRDRPGIEVSDRLLAVTSLSFDIAGLELFLPLVAGASVEIAGSSTVSDGALLAASLSRQGITILQATPSTYRLLLDAGWTGDPRLELLVGGEAVPRELVNRLSRCAGSVWNMYGPTETTIWSSVERLSAGEGPVSIGRPIANTRAYIVDPWLDLAPLGVPGELCLAGEGLARGYLGRPELTASRFVEAPFLPGERMYRTGDRCRLLPDGRLLFLGRIDQQIKLRGHRIELGEIEAVLGAHPAIAEAAVALRDDARGEARLVAYLVARGDAPPAAAEIRTFLADRLPAIMIPGAYVALDALPLTANGKLDRRALPEPAPAPVGQVAPRGPVEEGVAAIFGEVLGIDPDGIDAHDGFFALGGHSLLGARAMARIRSAFGVELPLRALFEAPSVAALAGRVEEALRGGGALDEPPLGRVDRQGPLPLSFGEERLWLLDALSPGSRAYAIPLALRLAGRLDRTALRRALQIVVERQEALRTTFRNEAGRPVRVIHEARAISLEVQRIDPRPATEVEREAAARAAIAAEVERPFDLGEGPLLRASLVELGEDEHLLVLSMHHIVSDAWSIGVLLRELGAAYEAALNGRDPALRELPIQVADFAAWQRRRLQGDALVEQLTYWKRRLAGAPQALDLSFDHPPSHAPSPRGGRSSFSLGRALSERLGALARQRGVTLFMALLAGFFSLLHRLTGQGDLLVGAPIAGRSRQEVEGLIGFFVNTLVLRAEVSSEGSFLDLLDQVKQTCLGAYAHQDLPFERLVQEVAGDRSASSRPLVQVTFALQNQPREALELPGLVRRPLASPIGPAKFDLSLTMSEGKDGLQGTAIFDAERFEPATVERMMLAFRMLLEGAVADPSLPVAALPLLDPAGRAALSVMSRGPAIALPADAVVTRLVDAQVARDPDAVAVESSGRLLRYGALQRESVRLAHLLGARGAGPGARVGVCLERSAESVIAQLGVLRAGAAFVALDPAHPAERTAFALRDAGAALLVTQPKLASRLSATGATLIVLDAAGSLLEREPEDAIEGGAGPEDPAYVIYTSGSTGAPKGVEIAHRGLANLVLWHRRFHGLGPGDRTTLVAAPGFDASVWEIWSALAAGATLVVPDELTRASPQALTRWLIEQRITQSFLPTPLAEVVLAEPWPEGAALRVMLTGGDRLRRRPPAGLPFRLVNHYGPTEVTVVATAITVDPSGEGPPPIGFPIDNLSTRVLDSRLAPVPIGVPGELYIGGVGLARGYVGQPALTAERFLADPAAPLDRLYRSGDRVRLCPGGALEFLGRIDDQVKVRGQRIELGEIEAALLREPSVREAAVALREDRTGEPSIAAYLVLAPGAPPVAALRDRLRQILPAAMIPSSFVILAALPLTENGKVDRRALPAPDPGAGALDEEADLGSTGPVEDALRGLFAELLGRDPTEVGPTADFFALGGHSLLAARTVARIAQAFAVDLPLLALFEAATPRALARRVEQALRGGGSPLAPLARAPRDAPLPLSFAQERLWFLDQLSPGDAAYVIPLALRLEGPLEIELLGRALSEIVRRHEALRTTFALVDGQPSQRIAPPAPVSLPCARWPALPRAERERAAERAMAERVATPFDLTLGPLVRAELFELDVEEHVLLVTMHHIVSDGWTMGLFVSELGALYRAFSEGAPSPLPEQAIQYADHAAWQRASLSGPTLDAEIAYFRDRLDGAPSALDLPLDHPRPSVESHRGDRVRLALTAALTAALRDLSRREGATLYMTLLAGFYLLLHRLSGQDDIVVGSPVAGRSRPETERMMGFFVNTLALRVTLDPARSFRDLLDQVKQTCLGAYAHQDLPFERLVQAIAPERDLARAPLFQVMFTLQNAPRTALSMPGLRVSGMHRASATSKFDLTLALSEGAEGLQGSLEYAADLFEAGTIERMVQRYQQLLEGAVERPEAPLAELPILLPEEERLLMGAWAEGASITPSAEGLHHLVETAVDRAPGAVALIDGEARVSYREMDARANRLAHVLRARVSGPDALVGVCLERSADLVIALLAILKAGLAYVPLDPAYPAARLSQILDDARVSLVLAQRSTRAALPPQPAPVLSLDEDAALGDASDRRPDAAVRSSDLAYVLFTSGSTGRPKGVAIEHRSPVALIDWARTVYPPPAVQAVLFSTSISFDLSVFEIFLPLASGGAVVVAESALALPSLPARGEITLINTVPTAITELLRMRALPPSARIICLAGEPLLPALVEQIYAEPSVDAVDNLYGPTEDTTYSTFVRVERGAPVTIGRPIGGGRVRLLDRRGRLVPPGVAGEIYLGGKGLARGYLGRPELTAERFVADPYAPGERLYRTGDLGRLRADGAIEYLGRIDHQVKVRGYRIELGEIESALLRHPRVREAVALAREDRPGDKRLWAYVVPSPEGAEGPLTPGMLRAHLAERLPDHMVPSTFVLLERLPLTRNGKVDRKALPGPSEIGAAEPDRAEIAPEGPVEETLAAIWAAVLRVPHVGVNDNFFEIGGDSILSIQIVVKAQQAGLTLTPRQLFQHQTIAELARVVERRGRAPEDQGPVVGAAPLTPIQRWWLEQELEDAHHWNQAFVFETDEALDPGALDRALAALVAHHDTLRLRLARSEGRPTEQRFAPVEGATEGLLMQVDLAGLGGEERRARALSAAMEAQASLDLARGPVLRAAHFPAGDGEPDRLLLAVHHLAIDAVSWRVLLDDLLSAYDAERRGEPVKLPPKTTSFKRWAEALVEEARGDAIAGELPFWLSRLRAIVPTLPVDHDHGANTEASARSIFVGLDAAETESLLRDVPRAYRTQINDVLLAAFGEALAGWLGSDRILFDLEGHGREEISPELDLSRTIGWFTTVFPVILEIPAGGDPSVVLPAVKEQLRAIPRHGTGYGLLRYLRPEDDDVRALQAAPHAEIAFNYLGQLDRGAADDARLRRARLDPGPTHSPRARRRYLLEATGSVLGGRLQARFTYSENRHDPRTIEALGERFIGSLRALIAHCTSPGAGGYTPSDFEEEDLSQEDIRGMLEALDGEDQSSPG